MVCPDRQDMAREASMDMGRTDMGRRDMYPFDRDRTRGGGGRGGGGGRRRDQPKVIHIEQVRRETNFLMFSILSSTCTCTCAF